MDMTERKERAKERRKNTIIDAAEKVFESKGIDQATMDEVAQKAKLSKGTLYLYFKNKTELYLAISERGSNLLNSRFSKLFAENKTGLELIRSMGKTYLDFIREYPNYLQAFMYFESMQHLEGLGDSELIQTCEKNMRDAMAYMVRSLQIGMQDGTIDDTIDPKELAVLIWGSTRGIITMSHMSQRALHHDLIEEMQINMDKLFDSYLDFLSQALENREKAEND